jgi:hypothetical protein
LQPKPGTLGHIVASMTDEQIRDAPSLLPRPVRNLEAEHNDLRLLVRDLPGLQLRKAAAENGLPTDTYDALFAEPSSRRYRRLTNPRDADILWQVLRDLVREISARLPENQGR